MLSLGTYPDTSLAAARRKAEAARELVAEGFDPSKKRQAEKAAYVQARAVEVRREQGLPPLDSFEATAREWFAVKRGGWAPSYADKIIARPLFEFRPMRSRASVKSRWLASRRQARKLASRFDSASGCGFDTGRQAPPTRPSGSTHG